MQFARLLNFPLFSFITGYILIFSHLHRIINEPRRMMPWPVINDTTNDKMGDSQLRPLVYQALQTSLVSNRVWYLVKYVFLLEDTLNIKMINWKIKTCIVNWLHIKGRTRLLLGFICLRIDCMSQKHSF